MGNVTFMDLKEGIYYARLDVSFSMHEYESNRNIEECSSTYVITCNIICHQWCNAYIYTMMPSGANGGLGLMQSQI